MNPLEPPDLHSLNATQGWLELGCVAEAAAELDLVSPAHHHHPAVLQIRWQVLSARKEWEDCLHVARTLREKLPDHPAGWDKEAISLHKLGRTREAWELAHPRAGRFRKEAQFLYNLACYEAQLGNLDQARMRLKHVFTLGPADRWQTVALEDPDLQPLWDEIRAMRPSSEAD